MYWVCVRFLCMRASAEMQPPRADRAPHAATTLACLLACLLACIPHEGPSPLLLPKTCVSSPYLVRARWGWAKPSRSVIIHLIPPGAIPSHPAIPIAIPHRPPNTSTTESIHPSTHGIMGSYIPYASTRPSAPSRPPKLPQSSAHPRAHRTASHAGKGISHLPSRYLPSRSPPFLSPHLNIPPPPLPFALSIVRKVTSGVWF